MLTQVLHRLVSYPRVYDAVQVAVGAKLIERVLGDAVARLHLSGTVIDIGGGTGIWKRLVPEHCFHVCLDIDRVKLAGFLDKHTDGVALLADATALPLADATVDAVMCTFVAHHLSDVQLESLIAEAHRVLRRGGSFIFADPLWIASRWPGRLLWRYDRGRFPRTAETHRAAIARRFDIVHEQRFAFVHAYLLLVGRKAH